MDIFELIQNSAHLFATPNDSLGHGILSDFSPQEDIIKYFYFECKDETRFVFSFKNYLTRLIWIQRLAHHKAFYLYEYANSSPDKLRYLREGAS